MNECTCFNCQRVQEASMNYPCKFKRPTHQLMTHSKEVSARQFMEQAWREFTENRYGSEVRTSQEWLLEFCMSQIEKMATTTERAEHLDRTGTPYPEMDDAAFDRLLNRLSSIPGGIRDCHSPRAILRPTCHPACGDAWDELHSIPDGGIMIPNGEFTRLFGWLEKNPGDPE